MATKDQQAQHELSNGSGNAAPWRLDPEASEIAFSVRKMGLYTVRGTFRATAGEMHFDEHGEPASANVRLDAASVSTRMPPRDVHLRSGHFLAAKEYPVITLHTDDIVVEADGALRAPALATIKGETRRLELRGHRHEDAHHHVVHMSGAIDRSEFGIRPPFPLDRVVGRHVDLDALLAFVR